VAWYPDLHHIHLNSQAKNMMQKVSHKPLALGPSRQNLGQKVRLVIMSVHICRPPFIPSRPLPNKVVSNALGLLLEGRVRKRRIVQDGLVVTINVAWPIQQL